MERPFFRLLLVLLFSIIGFPRTPFATLGATDFWRSPNVFSRSVRRLSAFRESFLCLGKAKLGKGSPAYRMVLPCRELRLRPEQVWTGTSGASTELVIVWVAKGMGPPGLP